MYTFIELCRTKPAWAELSTQDREAFLAPVKGAMEQLQAGGTNIVSWGFNDPQTPQRSEYDFFAVFEFPSQAAALDYERLFSMAGWYQYFEQVNVAGASEPFQTTLERLKAL